MAYTTIDNPELYFQTKLYTGNGSTQSITLDGDENMQPDMVWIKVRSTTGDHGVFDSQRGGTTKFIRPNKTNAETTSDSISSLNSDGFSLGAGWNDNTATFVAWCWKESSTAGFDIVTYTGNETDDTDISHSLSAVPHAILVKKRNGATNWVVYHQGMDNTHGMYLDTTSAKVDSAAFWSDEDPTSSVFTLGDSGSVNGNTDTFVAYLFSEKQGYSKFGSYTGNGNADGEFIYLGFRPALVIIKSSSATSAWYMWDNKRLGYNVDNNEIYASSNHAEQTDDRIDLLSNGFKMRTSDSTLNGGTLIYMAFAEAPFVNSNGVPCNAR